MIGGAGEAGAGEAGAAVDPRTWCSLGLGARWDVPNPFLT